jgi:transposase
MVGGSSTETDRIGFVIGRGDRPWINLPAWTSRWKRRMSVSWTETVVLCTKQRCRRRLADIEAALAHSACRRVVFETGRMAPMLYHGLSQRGLLVVCVESRQAYQALRLLATHNTDRNDARGLAHRRTGFFKPVHVKSLPAHAVRSPIIARKKLVGQRVSLENQIGDLAVVFGVRLPQALSPPSSNRHSGRARALLACLRPCRVSLQREPPCSAPSRQSAPAC